MPRLLSVAFFSILFLVTLNAQVYHFETGKHLGINQANQIVWKVGVFNHYAAQYGTLVVKENRSNRASKLINIPVIQIKAVADSDSLPPLFLLHGGPGESNLQSHLFFEEFILKRDVVLVGYRGVDGSVQLDCPCMKTALLSDTLSLNNASNLFRLSIDTCLNEWKKKKIDILGYSMIEVIKDIEIARQKLGYNQIDFLAFSYGTMLGELYSNTYPQNIRKMAMVGPRPLNGFLFEDEIFTEQLQVIFSRLDCHKSKQNNDRLSYSDIEGMLKSILENNKEFNSYRFYFFVFSKLYTIHDFEMLLKALKNANIGIVNDLLKQYNEFYESFPNNLILGDVVAKKQGRVDFKNQVLDTHNLRITSLLNDWYSPNIELLELKPNTYIDTEYISIPTLYIAGEMDIASPPKYFISNDSIHKELIIIPNTGHLDLFYSGRDYLKNTILEYLNK